jgi:hypothetical protein
MIWVIGYFVIGLVLLTGSIGFGFASGEFDSSDFTEEVITMCFGIFAFWPLCILALIGFGMFKGFEYIFTQLFFNEVEEEEE